MQSFGKILEPIFSAKEQLLKQPQKTTDIQRHSKAILLCTNPFT